VGQSKSADSLAARQVVYAQLAKRFPKQAIEWVKLVQWAPVQKYDLDEFDAQDEKSWAAYRSPAHVEREVEQYKDGDNDPLVGVIGPGKKPKIEIIDGHHRYLAREKMGKNKVEAYVATVPSDEGPWSYTHLSQKGGDSG
jgi:hypothetical protein